MKIMKQIASRISIYSADAFGVCSALYELGGLCVMHDASGCNSTYNTHDEPRWYDFDSMVYISGISEMEAIMGDDQKFIDDIIYTAKELNPKFIALAGTPIPTMIGTDFKAIANIVENETKIPTFGFNTTGMNSYVSGAYKAFEALSKRFLKRNDKESRAEKSRVNILGATPLDFSINNSIKSTVDLLKENDFELKEVYDIKDIYMIDKKYKNIEDKLELLKHAILIRDIIEENKETKQITYKYKEYDENGNITKQGKTNCKINSIEEAVNLFNALGYEKLININDHLLVYANKDDEFVIECVNNKHIYIEIEDKCNYIDKCYKSDEEMKDAINKYNLPLKQNNYYAKKALDELNEI